MSKINLNKLEEKLDDALNKETEESLKAFLNKKEVKKTVGKIIDSLCDRSGFDDWWYNIDDSIQEEIMAELENIILNRLKK